MDKYITVKEAARELNVPVETVHSWIEQGVIHETPYGLPWDRFVETLESDDFKAIYSILNQKVLGSDEE
ncbi:MAG: helix-turn-helix domain-containing protein [Bacillaceae bacterium]|nr:helix-turn-helix domain-containing protein [Bacillaceae bacterium]